MKTYARTDIGPVRSCNEDRYLIRELPEGSLLLAVADGMGGQPGGEIAASAVVEALSDFAPASPFGIEELSRLIRNVSDRLLAKAEADEALFGMGSTVIATVVLKGRVHWVHVGDSRLYHLSGDRLTRITIDQNMAQFLVEEGELTPEEARLSPTRNMLDQCVGCPECEPVTGYFAYRPGDSLFLCSDGVHDFLAPETLAALLTAKTELETKIETVVRAVLNGGGTDNITLIGAELGDR